MKRISPTFTIPTGRRAARLVRRLPVPVAAYLLMAVLLWIGCRFQVSHADPLDVMNNTFVDAGIRQWGGFPAVTAVNPFEGMGSLFMPLNPWLSSHDAPVESVTEYEQPFKPAVGHRPFARHLFLWLAWYMLGVYLLARALHLKPLAAAAAAQAAAVVALPPFTILFFEGSFSFIMNPALVIPVSLCLVLLSVFWRGRPSTPRSAAALAAALLALGLATLWSDPLFAGLFGAMLLPFFLAAAGESVPATLAALRRERSPRTLLHAPLALKLGAAALALLVLKLAGPLDFLSVIARYSARQHFPTEIHGEMQTSDFVVFPLRNGAQMALGAVLAIGCLAGVALTRGRRRLFSVTALLHLALLATACAAYLGEWFPWRYPLPLYLEIPSLPLYVIGAVSGFSALGVRARRRLGGLSAPFRTRLIRVRRLRRCSPALLPATALLALGIMIGDVPTLWKLIFAEPLTALSTVDHLRFLPDGFLEHMRRTVRLQPGAPFRGRVASVVGVGNSGVVSVVRSMRKQPFNKWYWNDINTQLGFIAPADFSATPWTTGLPTVAEYSHLISPPYYYFFSRLLNRRGDFQSRNLLWPTVTNVDALAAMGVRYLVTDAWKHHSNLRVRGKSALVGTDPQVLLYLSEILDPNLGGYSPTAVTVIRGGRETMEHLRAPGFDWRREVVLAEPLAGPLVPLERLEMRVLPNGIHVEGSSPGRSLALLPVEFSRCWVPDDPSVRLVRADLAMTGLVFEGKVSTTIRFRFGFFNPGRRLRDLEELPALDLAPDGWVGYPEFISALPVPRGRLARREGSRGAVPAGS